MADDLSAFFAKKAQKKSKKKNIVSLDDVGQQLERKVKIQETGESDFVETSAKEQVENFVKTIQSNEDSEWIEISEKQSVVGIAFKEFTDNNDEFVEEEKKGVNIDTNKTWNIIEKKENLEEIPPPVKLPSKFQAFSGRKTAAPLDLNNQEMFPSIAAAEQKLEEKKKLGASAKQEEQFDQVENKRTNVYRVPARKFEHDNGNRFESTRTYTQRGNHDLSLFKSGDRLERSANSGFNRRENYDASSDTSSNWRDTSRTYNSAQNNYGLRNQNNNEAVISKAEESDNWRSSKKSSIVVPQTSTTITNGTTALKSDKYLPPFLRKKLAENV